MREFILSSNTSFYLFIVAVSLVIVMVCYAFYWLSMRSFHRGERGWLSSTGVAARSYLAALVAAVFALVFLLMVLLSF